MPNVSQVVTETKQSVLRPAVLDVVRQILDITKIPSTIPILYPDDIGKAPQLGSAISGEETDSSMFPNSERVYIEVEEDYDQNNMSSTPMAQQEYVPIFGDEKLGVYIKPVYSKTVVSIVFKYNTTSKSMANRWRDDIRMRISGGRDLNLHKVTYHYIIPQPLIGILKEIHRLRELNAGYGDSFEEYLQTNATDRMTSVSNLSGTAAEPAIAESQFRIVGMFDFESIPEKIGNDEDNNGWQGSFTYKFTFDKPIACNMRYPIMVHNSVLSTDFRPIEQAYNLDNQIHSYSLSFNAFSHFECTDQIRKYIDINSSLTVPNFDEFAPNSIPSGTVNIFNALCQISNADKRNLINLREVDPIIIDKDILDFIEAVEYRYITKPYQSILNISFYKFGNLMEAGLVDVTSNLDVVSTKDLSLRDPHRIRFSICADISYLQPSSLIRLKNYPKAFVKIFSAINESLGNNPGFKDLGYKRQITKDDIDRHIYGRGEPGRQILMRTVQRGSVIALHYPR